MAEVIVTEFMDPAAVARLASATSVLVDADLHRDRARLLDAVRDARVLVVRNQTSVDAELLEAAPRLELVGRLGVGLDNIDVAACRRRGVEVVTAAGANATAVAEYVLGAALHLLRFFNATTASVASGEWDRTRFIGGELSGRRLGLLGFGTIARAVAARAGALGMEVWATDPYLPDDDPAWGPQPWGRPHRGDLDAVIERADILSIHVPLTAETRRLVDAARIGKLPAGAIVVNTARGPVVDLPAVAAALETGGLGGAVIDVFDSEPPDPGLAARLAATGKALLTPHIVGLTHESQRRVGELIATAVLAHLER